MKTEPVSEMVRVFKKFDDGHRKERERERERD
jgi:hypothetical protein